MAPPQRENFYTIIDELTKRIERLESSAKQQYQLPIFNVPAAPASPGAGNGGVLYVQTGQLKYVGSNGTRTTIANS